VRLFGTTLYRDYLLPAVCVDAVEKRKSKSYIPQFNVQRCEQINILLASSRPAFNSPHGLARPYSVNNGLPVGSMAMFKHRVS
jgi:hypothetical protein